MLRDGKKVGDLDIKNTNKKELVSLIVGKKSLEKYTKENIRKGKVILEVKNLGYLKKFESITFELREGEIKAFFGLIGSGVYDLMSVLFGDNEKSEGEIFIENKKVRINHPYISKINRMGYIPIDRKEEGLALSLDVKKNITSTNIQELGKSIFLNDKIEREHASFIVKKLNIKTPNIKTIVENLSGGNQQKVVIGKWLEKDAKILILCEPTRGIDVGSKLELYKIMAELCKDGAGIVIASTELPEIFSISDNIIVMKKGKIVADLITKETNKDEAMRFAIA